MNCIILGAGPGLPNLENNLSSLVVQTSEGNYLVDCGDSVSQNLLRKGFSKDYLDAVFISHYHPDHVAGLYMLLQMLYLEGRTKALHLFLPERPDEFMDTLHMFYTFEYRFAFKLKVHECKEAEYIYSGISATLTDHLLGYESVIRAHKYPNTMQSFSFSFTEDKKTLMYTSDLGTFNNIMPQLQNSDVIIMDALHPDAQLIISFLKDFTNRVILTHGISDELKNWLQNNPLPHIELAQEDKIYHI